MSWMANQLKSHDNQNTRWDAVTGGGIHSEDVVVVVDDAGDPDE